MLLVHDVFVIHLCSCNALMLTNQYNQLRHSYFLIRCAFVVIVFNAIYTYSFFLVANIVHLKYSNNRDGY